MTPEELMKAKIAVRRILRQPWFAAWAKEMAQR